MCTAFSHEFLSSLSTQMNQNICQTISNLRAVRTFDLEMDQDQLHTNQTIAESATDNQATQQANNWSENTSDLPHDSAHPEVWCGYGPCTSALCSPA